MLQLQLGVQHAGDGGGGNFGGDVLVHRPLSYSSGGGDACQSKRWRLGSTAKNKDPIFTGGYIEIRRDLSGCHLCREEREDNSHLDCEKCLLPEDKLQLFFFLA